MLKRVLRTALCIALVLFFVMPLSASAQRPEQKLVRVGWYDSSYNTMDESGRRSGYAYEYQLKISAYTGWTYEYVTGSWSDLLGMLVSGEIDLMSDVSFTPERDRLMLFSTLPMGTEEYFIFTSRGNTDISSADYSTLNGKRVGVNKDSIQTEFYAEWAQRNGVNAEVIEVTCSEAESLNMLDTGELDAYVTVDSFIDPECAVPVSKVGSSDFYFAVSRARPDLLEELNNALSRIQDENRFYNQQMFEKYIKRVGANAFITTQEAEWLSEHGTIRVGYQDNYLAFCASDKATGELTGVLKDYLAIASERLANARIDFEATSYPTAASAMDALKRGEVDCVFPANLGGYDAEAMGLIMSPALMSTEVLAVVRAADSNAFANREHVIVAVNEGNPNYDAFLVDHFPSWRKVYYPNTDKCLQAVSAGVADCVLISNYRFNNIARQCSKYHLTTLTTGIEMDYCFAVGYGQSELYSILAKTVCLVPSSSVNAALSYYIVEDSKLTVADFITENLPAVTAVTAFIVLLILTLLIQNMRAVRRAKNLISATETDSLTGLYNRDFFIQYASRMFKEHPETPMDAISVNIEQFHSLNALNGRDFGDRVLRALGNEILSAADEMKGIAGRIEADGFDIYCRHSEDFQAIFDRLQARLDALSSNVSIRIRMGVMPWQQKMEPVQLFDRARTACSMARGHYKEHLIVFDEKVNEREIYEQRLLNDLRHSLDTNEFEVFYQPKFDIQSEPPKLVSAEALVRWRHKELGMISPGDFIPLFEKNGQIGLLDKYVWEEAASQVARWRDKHGVTLPVSVNLSRVDVFDPQLEETLDEILRRNNLKHNAFKLEVTESAYTENADQVIQVVEGLRRKGYEVEMDDFGTGYSSLNMLSDMPIDVLKMDRAFVRNIEHDKKDIQLVALILDIAKNLNVPVIAEGVETEEQMLLLKDMGCSIVQGYYFSKPLHSKDFEAAFIRNLPKD